MILNRFPGLPSFKKYFPWLSEEENNDAEVLEILGAQNNLNILTWMLLGSKAEERTDRPRTLLTIGVAKPDIKKVREQAGCRVYYGLGAINIVKWRLHL